MMTMMMIHYECLTPQFFVRNQITDHMTTTLRPTQHFCLGLKIETVA